MVLWKSCTCLTTLPGDPMTMEPSGKWALVTNRHADQVTVIDVKTHRQIKAIPVGRAPHGMALRPR